RFWRRNSRKTEQRPARAMTPHGSRAASAPSRARRGSYLGQRPRASAARSTGRRGDVRDGSPEGQDAADGLMRSTTARPAAVRRRDTPSKQGGARGRTPDTNQRTEGSVTDPSPYPPHQPSALT